MPCLQLIKLPIGDVSCKGRSSRRFPMQDPTMTSPAVLWPYTSSRALFGGPPRKSASKQFLHSKQSQAPLNQSVQYDVLSADLAFTSIPWPVPKGQEQVPSVQIQMPGEHSSGRLTTSPRSCSRTRNFPSQASLSLLPPCRWSSHYLKIKKEPLFGDATTAERGPGKRRCVWKFLCISMHPPQVLFGLYAILTQK